MFWLVHFSENFPILVKTPKMAHFILEKVCRSCATKACLPTQMSCLEWITMQELVGFSKFKYFQVSVLHRAKRRITHESRIDYQYKCMLFDNMIFPYEIFDLLIFLWGIPSEKLKFFVCRRPTNPNKDALDKSIREPLPQFFYTVSLHHLVCNHANIKIPIFNIYDTEHVGNDTTKIIIPLISGFISIFRFGKDLKNHLYDQHVEFNNWVEFQEVGPLIEIFLNFIPLKWKGFDFPLWHWQSLWLQWIHKSLVLLS